MKKLFLYYSYSGNGDFVAEAMKEKGYDIRKVETVKGLPKVSFFAMLAGGFQASAKKKAELKEYNQDVSKYDEIVIGSPIWNGRISPAINTVLANLKLNENQKLAFVFYAGGGTGPSAEKRIKKEYPNARYVFLKAPKQNEEELEKLKF